MWFSTRKNIFCDRTPQFFLYTDILEKKDVIASELEYIENKIELYP